MHEDEFVNVSCVLLVSGGQIFEGNIELFVKRNISMIPSKVPHRSTKVRVNSKNRIPDVSLQPHQKHLEKMFGFVEPSSTSDISDDAVSYNCYLDQ